MSLDPAFQLLVETAAARYRPAGRSFYHFARGKLGRDPVFRALLLQGLIPSFTRLTDLGCGQGVLLALLAAAEDPKVRAQWPRGRPRLPRGVVGTGVDLRGDAVRAAKLALGVTATRVQHGDIRTYVLPPSDVVTILDVLHYISYDSQRRVLDQVFLNLAPGGYLLLRAGDAAGGWRFRFTLADDWLITLVRGHWQRRFYTRTAEEWLAVLAEIGFRATLQPMSEGTPFANVLFIARKPE
jgi:SAM-dependent methyltransferase